MQETAKVIRILPYSYSSLTSFETCNRKHHGERLTKEFARPYNKAADDGDIIHKQAEEYAKHGTPFENKFKKQIIEILDELRALPGEFFAEKELCVDINRNPVGWWGEKGHARGKLDLLHLDLEAGVATIIDWKTGRPDPYSTQLKHNALLVFAHYPQIHTVHTRYEWLAKGYPTKGKVYREFYDSDWQKFEDRFGAFSKALKQDKWPAKPGFLCGKYCGVTTCEHYGKTYR